MPEFDPGPASTARRRSCWWARTYGQSAGEHHAGDKAIADYRDEWLDALIAGSGVEAVI